MDSMTSVIVNNLTLKGNGLSERATQNIVAIEKELKTIQEREKDLKQALLEQMKENGVKKIDTPELCITYIEPTDREKFNSKKFREENPDMYDKYVSFTATKESARIKLK